MMEMVTTNGNLVFIDVPRKRDQALGAERPKPRRVFAQFG